MKKIFDWLTQRRNDDSALAQFLKLGYALGQKPWLHSIISALMGIFIPIFFELGNYILFVVLIIVLILDILYASICNSYRKKAYTQRKFAAETLASQSSLLKSIVIEMENNTAWKSKIFKTVSNLVCEKIYQNFKEVFSCEARVAIEYVFNKAPENIRYVKMSGRRSNKRSIVKRSTALEKRKNYYSYKIFINNNNGINILNTEQLQDEEVWYKNPKNNVTVKKYIGIAVSVYDNTDVKFILEIDFLDDFTFVDDDNDAMKQFIDQYLMTYINIISIAYLLNLNGKKEIPEV